MIIIYTRLYENDPYTVKGADFGGYYTKTSIDLAEIILTKLTTGASIVLNKLLHLLNDNDTELIGTQGYRRIIPKNQSKIAEIIGVDRKYLSKAIANLEESNIVKYGNGMLIVNPLVFNQNSIYDIRALQAFGINQINDIPTKKFTDNVIMKKADKTTRCSEGF